MSNKDVLKLPPTKNALLRLRKQVGFLQGGKELLERKRELLSRLVRERLHEYEELRESTQLALEKAYYWLSIARLRMGDRAIQQAALGTHDSVRIEILPRRSLGVEYPSVHSENLPPSPVGLLGTDPSFDEARRYFAEAAALLAHLGEVELALSRLLAEERKARKRVNALNYNIIPRYQRTLGRINSALEESERDTLFQVQRLYERAG